MMKMFALLGIMLIALSGFGSADVGLGLFMAGLFTLIGVGVVWANDHC